MVARLAGIRVDYPRSNRAGLRRWLPSWRQILALVLLGATSGAALVMYAYARTDIPNQLNAFATQQDNVYYWSDGTELARSGWVNRQEVPLSRVPRRVRNAVLAAENASFYSDPGVSASGMTRAALRMITGGDTQGGSTITQQYVKNAYLNQDQNLSRKFHEMLLAVKVDNRLSKNEILEGYLNTSWFGRGTYGVQRAAQAYYGKEVGDLTVSEAAFLASVLKGASLYDPAISAKNHDRAVRRWKWILDRMVTTGALSPAERSAYKVFPEPKAPPKPSTASGQPGYLAALAKTYVQKAGHISDSAFDLGGYEVHTTFDRMRTTELATSVRRVTKGFDPAHRAADRHAHTGAASIASDGRILAVYGGPDFLTQGFNESNSITVPAGSAFTPFVYAAALRDGVQRKRGEPRTPVFPATVYDGDDDIPVITPEGPYWDRNGKVVKAENDGGRSWGHISLRDAMVHSVNAPLMQLGTDVGYERVARAAQDAGLLATSLGARVPGFSLGNSTPSALRMAAAYGTFAAGGVHTEPFSVARASRGGEPVALARPHRDRAFSAEVGAQVTDALRGALRGGGSASANAPAGAAGKAGTTADHTAGWFVGYTAQEATAVVVYRMNLGDLKPLPVTGLGGDAKADRTYPSRIWNAYLTSVAGRRPDGSGM
ncbi:transglycosylase domain-containing protein [Streptomyces sp. NBC_00344]|uniref:transglycosylase domain-containing protein n=1 Tax=Streptomyces sp. NBC_00344 TaxID=2975720 RepID=UPI002E239DC4